MDEKNEVIVSTEEEPVEVKKKGGFTEKVKTALHSETAKKIGGACKKVGLVLGGIAAGIGLGMFLGVNAATYCEDESNADAEDVDTDEETTYSETEDGENDTDDNSETPE